ncbi:(d)CMP kinase [Blautia sp. MSJ-19]|uniref:(d)CMP kinase n=1 Tax=Blautia sp. MSJ-19 TaxID=2841517 RepID=UPI001C0F0592|nr:(d)CMP kinase [Blautia sp. MSJ-19]MBU5481923.1 (d)CMP kinase [Blautia sp. MSJ-19]
MIYNIAIDGPAGAGKSTIARRVAKELSFIYVDTGAMYRAMAFYLLREGVDRNNTELIGDTCQNAEISIEYQDGEQIVLLNGENVNAYLRTEEVGNMASVSSAVPRVREKLLSLQRKLAKDMSVVMDGRDIGTTILPDADVKIYLTASSLPRARRRYLELQEKGETCNLDEIQKDIEERDQRDMNREISPLRQADDAVLVDSSDLTIEQVVDRILEIFRSKTEKEVSHES